MGKGKREGKWGRGNTTYGRWRSTQCSITHYTPPSSIHTAYNRWCSTPCSMKVSCTTPSIFYIHNVYQVTLTTVLYHTLHLFHLQYSQQMAGDAPHHAQTEYHAPHPPFSTHTTYGRWRSTSCSITHCSSPSSIHTMRYESIMHLKGKVREKEMGRKRERDRGKKEKDAYTRRVIANFVPNFVAMATGVGRGKMQLAAFDGPSPKTPL